MKEVIPHPCHLRYRDITEFVYKEKAKKFEKLLSSDAREYWDENTDKIKKGVIHTGRYEKYMALLKIFFHLLIGKKAALKVFSVPEGEREEFYQRYWNKLPYKVFTRIFLSKRLMCLLFDKRFYSYLEPEFNFNTYYRSAIKRAITELPVKENNFLSYVLTGNYTTDTLPVYLQKKNFEKIRKNLDSIETIHSSCIDFLKGLSHNAIDQFNFTNIFEWMSVEEYTNYLEECVRCGKDGSVIIYRNHLVTRRRPDILKDSVVPDMKLSKELHEQDLSFIYKDYIIEKIQK